MWANTEILSDGVMCMAVFDYCLVYCYSILYNAKNIFDHVGQKYNMTVFSCSKIRTFLRTNIHRLTSILEIHVSKKYKRSLISDEDARFIVNIWVLKNVPEIFAFELSSLIAFELSSLIAFYYWRFVCLLKEGRISKFCSMINVVCKMVFGALEARSIQNS